VVRALVTRADTMPVSFSGVRGSCFVGVMDVAGGSGGAIDPPRYVVSPQIVCGVCELCTRGLSQHCQRRATIGHHERDGGFAHRVHVPRANLVSVPAAVSDEAALLAHALAAALHVCRVVRIEGKTYVTVLGDGPDALLTAQAMAKRNASVRLIGTNPERNAFCERWGVKHRLLSEIGRRMDQDIVIDATGDGSGAGIAPELVRPRGTIVVRLDGPAVVAAAQRTPVPTQLDLARIAANEITLMGARDGSLTEAMGVLERREIDTASMIQGRFGLAQLGQALSSVRAPGSLPVSLFP
jgi:threonine dehydrogenase-like Zn-dependent dehydrogenase